MCETHGGWGKLYRSLYSGFDGVVFETSEEKADALAEQRPTWRVYQSDAEESLRAGIASDMPIDLFDVDPYGQPWPVLDAFFESERERPRRLAIVVNDGLRHDLVRGSSRAESIAEYVAELGPEGVYDHYLDICQDKLRKIASTQRYALKLWAGYYTGTGKGMTHYAALFERTGKLRRN